MNSAALPAMIYFLNNKCLQTIIPKNEDIDDIISDLDYEITSDTGSISYTELTDREIIQ